LNSEVKAREVIVYGAASGNLRARDRVEIKKDGELIGDNTAAPISVEDGASLKGRIEIERTEERVQTDSEPAGVSIGAITS
jgi:cytoskeletal protein CcmA (bactofilin family)